MSEKPHKRLEVWKQSMDLVVEVYRLTSGFPREERFGLVDQMRRAVVSVPSNIAEGAARQTHREFINFVHIAQGSLNELDTQLEIAERLGYLPSQNSVWKTPRISEIDRMLTGLIRSLKPPTNRS